MYKYFTQTEPEAYRNKSVRGVVAAWEEGKRGVEVGDKDDFQANCFAKVRCAWCGGAGTEHNGGLGLRMGGQGHGTDSTTACVRVALLEDGRPVWHACRCVLMIYLGP